MGEFMGKTLESICIGTEVQNAAISGTTAQDWAEYKSDVLENCEDRTWDLVYIAVGGNDLLQSGCTLTADELANKILLAVTNIIENIAPQASKYLLTGYCMPAGNEEDERKASCSKPSDYAALSKAFLSLDTRVPKNVQIMDSLTACGGSTSSFSNPDYFQDAIHLNNKGYCKVFTNPSIFQSLACAKILHDCDSPTFEITGLDETCDSDKISKCSDDTTWKHKGPAWKNCAWVSKKPGQRCRKSANGVKAFNACPIACSRSNQCKLPLCRKASDWQLMQKSGKIKNCRYLKNKKSKRCSVIGIDNTFGYEACKPCGRCRKE